MSNENECRAVGMTSDKITAALANPAGFATLLKTDLRLFIKVFHWHLTRRPFIFKWFHLKIIEALEDRVWGNTGRNLCITIPPRYGKSAITKYFIAWTYAINGACNNIYTSYSDELVLKFSAEIRQVIKSDLFNKLFQIRLMRDSNSKSIWKTSKGGETRAASLGGSITGFGAGIDASEYGGAIFLDDLLKPKAARSVVEKKKAIELYIETLKTRRNSAANTPFILIMQRIDLGDLVGWIKENEPDDWDFIEVQGLDENDESTWPERVTAAELKKMRDTPASTFAFWSQYQQKPIIEGGNLIKTSWIGRYQSAPRDFQHVFIIADTAFTKKKSGDYSAFILCGIKDRMLWALDGYCKRVEFPDLRRDIKAFYQNAKQFTDRPVASIDIENKASGQSLIPQLRADGLPVTELYPTYASRAQKKEMTGDKYLRLQEVSADLESGFVRIPDGAPWAAEFLSQCEAFTGGDQDTHDDYVDCLIYALKKRRKILRPRPTEPIYGAMAW